VLRIKDRPSKAVRDQGVNVFRLSAPIPIMDRPCKHHMDENGRKPRCQAHLAILRTDARAAFMASLGTSMAADQYCCTRSPVTLLYLPSPGLAETTTLKVHQRKARYGQWSRRYTRQQKTEEKKNKERTKRTDEASKSTNWQFVAQRIRLDRYED